jgi:hypothetical protein
MMLVARISAVTVEYLMFWRNISWRIKLDPNTESVSKGQVFNSASLGVTQVHNTEGGYGT